MGGSRVNRERFALVSFIKERWHGVVALLVVGTVWIVVTILGL